VWDLESGEEQHINPLLLVDDLLEKGKQLYDSEEFEEALIWFERVIKQQPENSDAQVYYLSTLSWMDMSREVVQSANHVIENDLLSGKDLMSVYLLKGHAMLDLGQYEQALKCFLMTSSLLDSGGDYNDVTEAYIGLCYLHLDDIVNADLKFCELISMGSELPLTFYGYGVCLIMNNEPEQGCKWLRRFLEDPGEELLGYVPKAQQIVDKIC
jgi:tetratricopeptide (TPR) repeat protein